MTKGFSHQNSKKRFGEVKHTRYPPSAPSKVPGDYFAFSDFSYSILMSSRSRLSTKHFVMFMPDFFARFFNPAGIVRQVFCKNTPFEILVDVFFISCLLCPCGVMRKDTHLWYMYIPGLSESQKRPVKGFVSEKRMVKVSFSSDVARR